MQMFLNVAISSLSPCHGQGKAGHLTKGQPALGRCIQRGIRILQLSLFANAGKECGHCLFNHTSTHSRDSEILSLSTLSLVQGPKERAPKCMTQKLKEIKKRIDNSTIMVGDFKILLSIIHGTRQKINKK